MVVGKLGVATSEDVEKVVRDGSLKRALGGKTNMASHVLRFIELGRWSSHHACPQESVVQSSVLEGVPLVYAAWIAHRLLQELRRIPGVLDASTTGALRRCCEIVPSVDIILCSEKPKRTARQILAASRSAVLFDPGHADPVHVDPSYAAPVHATPAHAGPSPSSSTGARSSEAAPPQPRLGTESLLPDPAPGSAVLVTLVVGGVKGRIYVADPGLFPGYLQKTTGSPGHNRQLEMLARERGISMDSGILVHLATGKKLALRDEAELYRELGLPFIPPEFREGADEIDAARRGRLSSVLQPSDVRGDLHVHTNWSDGLDSIDAMAEEALRRGYEYVAICDHTAYHSSANGLSRERLLSEWAAIDEARRRFPSLTIMKGVEVDILPDGRLDLSDDVLQAADIVLASVHDQAGQSREDLTCRILKAMENPHVDILAHPTGRRIGCFNYSVDVDAILDSARRTGVALEINCAPDRFDIDERLASKCNAAGVMTAIGSDSHSTGEMSLLDFGVVVARRAHDARSNVLNAMTAKEILAWLAARGIRAAGGSTGGR